MKKILLVSLLTFFVFNYSFSQWSMSPPLGSTYNADSSVVSLPEATVGMAYSQTLEIAASDTFTRVINGVSYDLVFVTATLNGLSLPSGMVKSCEPPTCVLDANNYAQLTLSGVPVSSGIYSMDITASLTIRAPSVSSANFTIPIPYDGSISILNDFLQNDYSIINGFLPTFSLDIVASTVGVEELNQTSLSHLVLAPNPTSDVALFTFYSQYTDDLIFQVFDILGNLVFTEPISVAADSEKRINMNTSSFVEGVYIYKLSSPSSKFTGRMVINK